MDHIAHLEDIIFTHSKDEIMEIMEGFSEYHDPEKTHVSIKYDGAPAFCFGYDALGAEWIGMKSAANNPKNRCYSRADIIDKMPSGVCNPMSDLLGALMRVAGRRVTGKEVTYQADLMWTPYNVKTCDRSKVVGFQANTLVYTFDEDDYAEASYGVVVHTKIVNGLSRPAKDVDPFMSDDIVVVRSAVNTRIPQHGGFVLPVDDGVYADHTSILINRDHLEKLDTIHSSRKFLVQASNDFAKRLVPKDSPEFTNSIMKFVCNLYDNKIDTLKTEKAKARWHHAKVKFAEWMLDARTRSVFQAYIRLRLLKQSTINITECYQTSYLTPWIAFKDGSVIKSKHEGYVFFYNGHYVKLVDRNHFSMLNSNDRVLRGWESDHLRTTSGNGPNVPGP